MKPACKLVASDWFFPCQVPSDRGMRRRRWNLTTPPEFNVHGGVGPRKERSMANPQSTARIGGHPIHPMLIPFPIAFFVATFVCDLVYWQTANQAWATAALWLLGAGLVSAALAAVAGLTDFLGDRMIREMNDA